MERGTNCSYLCGKQCRADTPNPVNWGATRWWAGWIGEPTRDFSVCSAYKLLQNLPINPTAYALQNSSRIFYKQIWNPNIPTKIKITLWKLTWIYIPTNMDIYNRRLMNNPLSLRFSSKLETTSNVFRHCPNSIIACSELNLSWVANKGDLVFLQSLTCVSQNYSSISCRILYCALWACNNLIPGSVV